MKKVKNKRTINYTIKISNPVDPSIIANQTKNALRKIALSL